MDEFDSSRRQIHFDWTKCMFGKKHDGNPCKRCGVSFAKFAFPPGQKKNTVFKVGD